LLKGSKSESASPAQPGGPRDPLLLPSTSPSPRGPERGRQSQKAEWLHEERKKNLETALGPRLQMHPPGAPLCPPPHRRDTHMIPGPPAPSSPVPAATHHGGGLASSPVWAQAKLGHGRESPVGPPVSPPPCQHRPPLPPAPSRVLGELPHAINNK